MSVSLYRKYRPARFEDIVGQDHVARTLVNALVQDRVSHAYLFTGPRGTGKTSTAKILAMALNCEAGKGSATPTPDGTCPVCEAIRRGSSLDVVEMDAASNRTVEEVTETLLDKVHFAPLEGRMKVYILDEVHMLSGHAFNALLKTLEEPPAHAVFVLATTEPHKVPATILSRCQRFDFRRPSVPEVVSVLSGIARREDIEVDEAALSVIARAAGGSFRDAIGVLDQLATYSEGSISLQQTLDVLGVARHDLLFEVVDLTNDHDTQGALLFVDRLNQAGTDYNQFMKDLLSHLRDLYVVKHTVEPPTSMALTEEQLTTLQSQANRVSTARTLEFIDLLGEGLRAIRQGSEPRLELELALIKMTALTQDSPARPRPGLSDGTAGGVPGPDIPGMQESRSSKAPSGPTPAVPPSSGAAARTSSTEPTPRGTSAADVGRVSEAEPAPESARTSRTAAATGAAASPQVEPATRSALDQEARPVVEDTEAPRTDQAAADDDVPHDDSKLQMSDKAHQGAARGAIIPPELEHLRRAWKVVIDAVHKRRAGLAAVLGEGRVESLEGDELIIRFPAGFGFQVDQVGRGDNPQIIAAVLRQLTGRDLHVSARLAAGPAPEVPEDEDARILTRDELIRALKQEFDARLIDDGPTR